MADFTIKVILDVSAPYNFHGERTRTHEIPPTYGLEDRRRFYAIRLEHLADDLFEDMGWFTPLRHALLANAARASRIEELITNNNSTLAQQIRDVLETDSQDAIDLWGTPPIEGDD